MQAIEEVVNQYQEKKRGRRKKAEEQQQVSAPPSAAFREVVKVGELPRLPGDALEVLKIKAESGLTVAFKDASKNPKLCINCGGMRSLWFQALAGPHNQTPTGQKVTMLDGQMYIVVDDFWFPCPVCVDSNLQEKMLLEDCGVEPSQWKYTLNHIKGLQGKEEAYAYARELLAYGSRPVGLHIFYGPHGRGKSGVLKALVLGFIRQGVNAHYVRAMQMLQRIKSTYNRESNVSEDEVIAMYGGYQLIAIDELDVIGGSGWAVDVFRTLYDILHERRMVQGLVVALNVMDPTDDAEVWPYLASRLKQGSSVYIGGDDLRGM